MNPISRRRRLPVGLWAVWAWLMVALGGVSIGAGIVGGILAPSIVLDVVSFWPLVAIPLVAAVFLWRRHSPKAGALPPLLLIAIVALAVGLHLLGWSKLPSAAADLIGPPTQVETVSLTISLPGPLAVDAGDAPLYTVKLDRAGGSLGVPEALERSADGALSIDIAQRDGGRWFRTKGWLLKLARRPVWNLRFTSPQLDADLRELAIDSLTVVGSGTVFLGPSPATVTVTGALTLDVAPGASVEVHGSATVPPGWEPTDDGYRSPGTGSPISISVTEGSQLVIKEL